MRLPTIATMTAPQRKVFKASEAEFANAQRNFDFLMPYRKALYTIKEVCEAIQRGPDFVRELIDDGRLETHADSAFGELKSNRITRRSVVVYLARTALYDPAHFIDSIEELLKTLTNEQLTRLSIAITRIRANRPL